MNLLCSKTMKAKKRKKVNKAWSEFQVTQGLSDEAITLIRQVHGRVSELLRSFPDPPPASVDDWIRERHRQWSEKRRPANNQPAQGAEAPAKETAKKRKKKKELYDPDWAKAKELCRLNQHDIAMAKQLGFRPKSLMKNRPSPSQKWKAPVKVWIHDLYARRFGTSSTVPRSRQTKTPPIDDVPF